MKRNVFFIVMLAGMLSFAFGAEKGALYLTVPSAMASDKDSKDKDAIESKDKDSKDKDAIESKDKDSKDKDAIESKDNESKDSKDKDSKDSDSDGSCICPPGIASCICADGSTGDPGPDSSPTAPNSLRSIHGGS